MDKENYRHTLSHRASALFISLPLSPCLSPSALFQNQFGELLVCLAYKLIIIRIVFVFVFIVMQFFTKITHNHFYLGLFLILFKFSLFLYIIWFPLLGDGLSFHFILFYFYLHFFKISFHFIWSIQIYLCWCP